MEAMTRYTLRVVVAALADGSITAPASMANADVPAAMAAVRAVIPSISSGSDRFFRSPDKVTHVPYLRSYCTCGRAGSRPGDVQAAQPSWDLAQCLEQGR